MKRINGINRQYHRIIAVALTVIMFFSAFPQVTFASSVDDDLILADEFSDEFWLEDQLELYPTRTRPIAEDAEFFQVEGLPGVSVTFEPDPYIAEMATPIELSLDEDWTMWSREVLQDMPMVPDLPAVPMEYMQPFIELDTEGMLEAQQDQALSGIEPMSIIYTNFSLSVIERNQTSFRLSAIFPINGSWGNSIQVYRPGSGWVCVTGRGNNAWSGAFTVSNLRNSRYFVRFTVYDHQNNRWLVDAIHHIDLPQARAPYWRLIYMTPTSISYSVVFPIEGHNNNRLELMSPIRRTLVGRGARSGLYTIMGLQPDQIYTFYKYWGLANGGQERRFSYPNPRTPNCTTHYYIRHQTRDLTFYLRRYDVNRVWHYYYTEWRNRMQIAHEDMYHLTGRMPWPGERTTIRSTRYIGGAGAGRIIQISNGFASDIITNIISHRCWSFAVLHEMGHNFHVYENDYKTGHWYGGSWVFQAELMANLKVAYVMCRRNATVTIGGRRITGIAAYRDFFYRHAEWSFDRVFRRNQWDRRYPHNYSEDALTYSILRIQAQIGWEPFRQTFRWFNGLNPNNAPNPNDELLILNLFLTRLRDFSGRDVISMIDARALHYYGLRFGGVGWAIRYV